MTGSESWGNSHATDRKRWSTFPGKAQSETEITAPDLAQHFRRLVWIAGMSFKKIGFFDTPGTYRQTDVTGLSFRIYAELVISLPEKWATQMDHVAVASFRSALFNV